MARGLSGAAYRGRRYRFLVKVERAAKAAGLDAARSRDNVIVSDGIRRYDVRMHHGHMSNGCSVVERRVAVQAPELGEREFGSFTWMLYDAPAKAFWDGIDKGKFEPADMLAAMKEG